MSENKLEFTTIPVGFLEVNCYIIPSEKDGCVYIIDPGASPDKIAAAAESFGKKDYRILLTHAHIDHMSAVRDVMDKLAVSLFYLHEDDILLYKSPANELQPLMPAVKNPPKPAHAAENCEFSIIHTPGHTRGCVCYYFEDAGVLFSGDTLFRNSVGRTDLPGGDSDMLVSSIREKIYALPDDVDVFPGHGPATSVGHEKEFNQFVPGGQA